MIETHEKSKATFSMCFGGDNDIDLRTLITSLEGTVELISNVANAQDKDAFVKVNVVATREGSFIVDFAALATTAQTLITVKNVNFAKTCIESVCGLISIKKHLKGESPKKQETSSNGTTIENIYGENMTVNVNTYNFYTEENDKTISKIFANCDRDYLKIEDSEGHGVQVDRADFSNMRKGISLNAPEEERVVVSVVRRNLTIKRPDLTGASMWELIYNKNGSQKIIPATIEDEKFRDDVHNARISINAKTSILVELEIKTTIDEMGELVKSKYTVKKVLEVYQDNHVQMSLMGN